MHGPPTAVRRADRDWNLGRIKVRIGSLRGELMASATFPTDVSVSSPSSSSEALSLEPPGDVLYEVVDGRDFGITANGSL